MEAGAAVFGVSVAELTGESRTEPLVRYRHATMLAVRRLTGASYSTIGRAFGRHHETVMSGCGRARADLVAAVVDAAERRPADEVEVLRAEVAALRAEVGRLAAGDGAVAVSPGQLRLVVGA